MVRKCYSINNEDFIFSELCDAIIEAFDLQSVSVGDVVTVYEGDAIQCKAGDFGYSGVCAMLDDAYDQAGDSSEGYLKNVTKEQEVDLLSRLTNTINQWADDYGLQPDFCKVENIKEIRARFIGGDSEYEILEAEGK